jgi:dihydrolipoamide dehydrogenase
LRKNGDVTAVVIIGAGPGGYEAALVARQLGAEVTLIDRDGIGGSCVLTDCVPSKTLIATAKAMTQTAESAGLGVVIAGQSPTANLIGVDLNTVNARIKTLASKQSDDIRNQLIEHGVQILEGAGRFIDQHHIEITSPGGSVTTISADATLIATGARPRELESAAPDGERILTWEQLYNLPEPPARLIVVGSGVTGAEFASAYRALGSEVVLVSSRDRVLPGEDPDAAAVIENVFARRGIQVLANSRAISAERSADGADGATGVVVTLKDGTKIHGSHVLMAVGSIPNTDALNLEAAGVDVDPAGFITVDRVSRTTARNVYAAGDCTGVLMLASVAAMQGRIAMWHALGDAVQPLDRNVVSSTVFTDPEIATVGMTQSDIDSDDIRADVYTMPLATNARAKMEDTQEGFVKIFCRKGTRLIAGAVVVGPHASELIHVLALAIQQRLTADEVAATFTVYPSLSGSIAEAARRLHIIED